ncbi:aldo/keto reductase (plasmid) [Rhizobium grahamii]|uniref:Aldo/keto reductase n=1 Tax=Rhizobium grahamii TaxID=1120045 RepID=A0A5Q0CGQ4_9HYPH|nr:MULTISPECIES: aldo/keto reductase [Rhizobium]QFY63119.1 aldo/keto reductase [Rhizobium grahamii]QRM52118.1 aldo/keto reductase [Rhizobium sp. BG6]
MSLDSFVTLGRSALRVSPLTLGTMTFGEDWGWGTDAEHSVEILAEYLDRGGNSIDTANIYTNGHSEKIIGDYFAGQPSKRDRVVFGTKFFASLHPGDPNGGGAGRKSMIHQLEASLRRLQTDYVDIYWLHNWDKFAPIEETLRALDDLVRSGKIRYIGLSDLPAWKTAEASVLSHFRGWTPVIALQLEYSLLERTIEGEHVPMAEALDMAIMPWSPLKNGFLSGKYRRSAAMPADASRSMITGAPSEADYDVIDVLHQVAEDVGASPAAVALAWLRTKPAVTSILIGARRKEQFVENLAALEVALGEEHIARLDAISKPTLNFPAHVLETGTPMLGYGGTRINGVQTTLWPMLAQSTARY